MESMENLPVAVAFVMEVQRNPVLGGDCGLQMALALYTKVEIISCFICQVLRYGI
jgi:hypothetical protein